MKNKVYNKEEFYKAHLTRDARFDGRFYVAVKTTGIYCRPICPARKAKLENLEFYLHAEEAEDAGFRPCLRCRPETAPGSPAWMGTSTTVNRALRIIDNHPLNSLSIGTLSDMLGVGERWLRNLFKQKIGASPQKVILNAKLNLARNLLDNSSMSITDIAFASGFNSVRRFNDAFKNRFAKSPSELKCGPNETNQQTIFIKYRPPYQWEKLLSFFEKRVIPGVETVENGSYQRLFSYNNTYGWLKVSQQDSNSLKIDFNINGRANLLGFASRIRDVFDLDSDPLAIYNDLKFDKKIIDILNDNIGLRVPGCFDHFELIVRAIIGQRISVKAAQTVLLRFVNKLGKKNIFNNYKKLNTFFPSPEEILSDDLNGLGLPKTKIHSIKEVAKLIKSGDLVFDGSKSIDDLSKILFSIKGIGHWTVEYISMRCFKNPDAFPTHDLELQKQIKRLNLNPEVWTPWCSYVAIMLFSL